jgi:hypothetical protein
VESPPSVVSFSMECVKVFEAEKGQGIDPDICGGVLLPTAAEKVIMNTHGGVGLPMVGIGQLVRTPECVFRREIVVVKD